MTDPDDVTLTITEDDDKPVTASFEQDSYTVSEGSGVTVKVTLSAAPEREVVIPLDNTELGGATPSDYSVPASVSFQSGDTGKSITFTATDDNLDDDGESVELTFGTLPSGVSGGATTTTTVTITDDDMEAGKVTLTLSAIDHRRERVGQREHSDCEPGLDLDGGDHGDRLRQPDRHHDSKYEHGPDDSCRTVRPAPAL